MNKYVILTMVLAVVILSFFLYSSGYFPGRDIPESSGNQQIPVSYPQHVFPVYDNGLVNEVIEGEEESVTITFLNKESKEEILSYYQGLLTNAYQISEKNKIREYTSMGMKNDYIYSVVNLNLIYLKHLFRIRIHANLKLYLNSELPLMLIYDIWVTHTK